MKRVVLLTTTVLLTAAACGESRSDRLARELANEQGDKKKKVELPPDAPPHPTRDKLQPLLDQLYSGKRLPDVIDADIEVGDTYPYELVPGVISVVRIPKGLSTTKQARAIVLATAEADAWTHRPNARRDYADLVHRVMRGYGDDQKELILKRYADLRLLTFFNDPGTDALIAALPADVKVEVQSIKDEYTGGKQAIWDRWMEVKMYARRVVSGDEPFRSVLRDIKKELGQEEPPPHTWEDSQDPKFASWAQEIKGNEKLLTMLLNMTDLRDREEFLSDTHSVWAMEGSEKVPAKAKKLPIDKDLGFGALREDLGGGYNDMTYVFSRKLSGGKLKRAYLQSVIYGHLLSDFQMLATAGTDFAQRDENNVIDQKTSVVPDKYDALYAKCGSTAAVDTFINGYKSDFAILSDVSSTSKSGEAILDRAHNCVIEGARGDIYVPAKDDDKDVTGPAPGSRLGLYQMLARFEKVDVNLAQMDPAHRTEEDDLIDEQEALLKAIKDEENAGKGVK